MRTNISDVLLAPWISGVIITAIRLNLFSILSDQELTAEEIASECHAIPDRLKVLLDACISLGILELKNKKYINSHFSSVYLVEGNQSYVGDFLKIMNYESIQWFQLPDLIIGKEKKNIEIPNLRTDSKTFISAMNCIGHLGEAEALKDFVDLSGFKKMTDAGGGSGLYSLALCQKYPGLHSTVLDVKDTLAVTAELIANCQEAKRIFLKEGNFLKDPLGDNLDVVLLSDVMYGDSEAKIILLNAWNSLTQNGVLIVRGYYSDPERSGPLFGALFAVKQLVDNPERKIMSISNLENNVREAGFEIVRIAPLTEHSFVLIGKK
jgi:hypothetical protein